MALHKYHYITLDTKHSPRISLENIIAGETGNRFLITLTNNDEMVDLSEQDLSDEFIYRVVLRIDSDLGTRYQDSAVNGDGVAFITADTGDHGKCNILLHPETFTEGLNRCWLMIYSTQFTNQDRMIYSAEFQFTAMSADIDGRNEWHRGSTPTHVFETPFSLVSATEIVVTYVQDESIVCSVNKTRMTVDGDRVSWTLTASETSAMRVGPVNIQLKYVMAGVTDYSDIHVGKVLLSQGV